MKILNRILGAKSHLDKYEVECFCGRIFYPYVNNVNSGKTKRCGKGICHSGFVDLTGKTFGYLTVLGLNKDLLQWNVRCTCGKEQLKPAHGMVAGRVKSCGCMSGKMSSELTTKGEHSTWVQLYNTYKSGASYRGYSFNISFDQFKELCKQPCHYCGCVDGATRVRKRKFSTCTVTYNGLDRFDNAIGYELENIVPCCQNCNYAKGTQTFQEFETWLRKLFQHNQKTNLFRISHAEPTEPDAAS